MKPSSCLIFVFFIVFNLHSQNCKTLDGKTFFKSIKFGEPIPADLSACAKKAKNELHRVQYDSLSSACRKKYADIFTFLSTSFSFSQIATNRKGQIVSVELYSFFEDKRHGDSTNYSPPPNFTRLYTKMVSLYGKPATIQQANKTDSLFIKDLGLPQVLDWDCNNISLRLSIVYGAIKNDLNVIHLQISDRRLDVPEEEQSLQ